ncbi:sigma-70 family RNA polymerase sigma factor [Cellulosimicrobium cellulans]|uniref:sigma-70 family RNA polymerase sigma factor n=1 Tax=Cellulosimicrobium cellulans TaxID=1710 RepID=UPI002406746F|nr:sigma-70 family RNA polymerase sigma factor [Cellulosimicrobium cellulans]MDF9875486.1 RNA polymerase sigma factor (sigma-70 family) [Cellulosimicrobium cellulans]
MSAATVAEWASTAAPVSDLELINQVRAGSSDAFGALWVRHGDAGLRAARQITRRFDPEDLVQEAFTRVLAAIRRGHGPTDAFRPYLYSAIRRISMNWTRDSSEATPLEDLADQMDPEALFEDSALERTITGRAYSSLRSEWRAILWYTEVEGIPAREAGTFLGLSPNAAAALAYRAREGLRIAWLRAHVNSGGVSDTCKWSVERLSPYKRGSLARRDRDALEEHLTACLRCAILLEELDDLAGNLKIVFLPLVAGAGILALDALPHAGAAVHAASATHAASAVGAASGATLAATPPALGLASLTSLTAVLATVSVVVGVTVAGLSSSPPEAPTAPEPVAHAAPEYVTGTTAVPAPAQPEDAEVPQVRPPAVAPVEPSAGPPSTGTPPAVADDEPAVTPDPGDTAAPPGATPPVPVEPTDATPRGPVEPTPTPTPTDPPPAPRPPAAPGMLGFRDGAIYLPQLHGTGVPGALVIVSSSDGIALGETVVSENGTWTVTAQLAEIPAASLYVSARQRVDGVTSDASELIGPFLLEAPDIVELRDDVAVPTVVFAGRAGTVVEAFVDGVPTGNLHELGDSSLLRRVAGLAPGAHTLSLRYVDPATGRVGAARTVDFVVAEGRPQTVGDPGDGTDGTGTGTGTSGPPL